MEDREFGVTLGSMTIPLLPDRDGDCAASLRRALGEVHSEAVIIDLEHVPFLSSSELTELVAFRKRHTGPRIVLQHPTPVVLRTLNIVGFNKLFTIRPGEIGAARMT